MPGSLDVAGSLVVVVFSVCVCVVGEQPDSTIEDETATAAWSYLARVRLPASSQNSLVGSQDKMGRR